MKQLNASSRIMFEEAQKRGIRCTLFDDAQTILMEKNEDQWYTRGSRTSLQSSVGKTIADLKPLTKKILQHYHLPTAKGREVHSPEELAQLSQFTFPLVSKPLDERHGHGVIIGVENSADAEKIFLEHKQPLLFEEMLRGVEYRIVCVDFVFVAAAFRKPAHVVGDGEHTINELIAGKNTHPWRGTGHANNLTKIDVDAMVLALLAEQGLELTSVPASQQEVLLRRTANLSTGGEAWDVTDEVCEENRTLFEKIARVCDLNTIGIDVMCESLEKPIIHQSHAGVIEVNASPGLRMHHFPLQGQTRNVAGAILDMVEKNLYAKRH